MLIHLQPGSHISICTFTKNWRTHILICVSVINWDRYVWYAHLCLRWYVHILTFSKLICTYRYVESIHINMHLHTYRYVHIDVWIASRYVKTRVLICDLCPIFQARPRGATSERRACLTCSCLELGCSELAAGIKSNWIIFNHLPLPFLPPCPLDLAAALLVAGAVTQPPPSP